MLSLPEKSNSFSFFQLGESADLNGEPAEITDVKTSISAKKTLFGINSESVCSPEEETQPDSLKWIELEHSNLVGANEIVLKIEVNRDAPASSELKILYRVGGFTNAVPFTSPQDDSLINELLSQASQNRNVFCSAKTNAAAIKISSDPLVCGSVLCSRITMERDDGFKTRNNLAAELGQEFDLRFDMYAPGESIESVSLEEEPTIEILGGSAGIASFADKSFTASGTEKTSGTIQLKGIKLSRKTVLRLKVYLQNFDEPIVF